MSQPKNLYFLKLQDFHLPLAELESLSFFGFEISPEQRFVLSDKEVDISDSAFFDWGGKILIKADSYEQYLESMAEAQINVCDARIETPSAGNHPKVKKDVLFEVLEHTEGSTHSLRPILLFSFSCP